MHEPLTATPTIVRGYAWVAAVVVACWWVVGIVQMPLPRPPDPPETSERADGPGPTVQSIVMRIDGRDVDRVEADGAVTLVASIRESKAVSQLDFIWTVPVGEIREAGPAVTWWVPKGTSTPAELVSSLEVVERYPDFETGLKPEMREQRVRVNGPALQVNDSRTEPGGVPGGLFRHLPR
jgi:hypothetical protein